MTHTISRRSLTKGAAWAAPAVVTATTVPAYAASNSTPDVYFECPTDLANLTQNLRANITFVATSNQYSGGSVFSISYSTGAITPTNIYSAGKDTGKDTTGAYLIPGCGKTTCIPDVDNGFKMPAAQHQVVLYNRLGEKFVGTVASGTPAGCSPVTNLGVVGTWNIHTDLPYAGTVCLPLVGPENFLKQISVPVSLLYLDGLDIVTNANGESCCLYMNFTFNDDYNCVGTATNELISASFSYGLPSAPTLMPSISSVTREADGSTNGSYCTSKNILILNGANFDGATAVNWNGQPVTSFEVLSNTQIRVTMPTGTGVNGSSAGIFYPITVATAAGTSDGYNVARQLVC